VLYWKARNAIEKDHALFAHLVAADGKTVATYDSPPRKGGHPTSQWDPNVSVADTILIPVSADAPLGSGYKIEIGWYDPATQQRLAVVGASSHSGANVILIDSFTIVE